ncbi:MAG: acyl-CoA dehydrogenase family protein [Acidimicrobiales bacterium]|nr:acyl-CoA dehydrogenase family protein [Acidimicrobiales bacterium]
MLVYGTKTNATKMKWGDMADHTVQDVTAEQAALRTQIQRFLESNARARSRSDDEDDPGGLFDEVDESTERERIAQSQSFQARLADAGFAGITWPKEYGGAGMSPRELEIFNEEAAGYELPTRIFMIGHGMCGPTLLALGTEEQKRHYIPPMLRGDEIWCQLFSEPGAGSDVASLQTRAVRDGDEWTVNGQKVWTSGAHYADYGILIARTNPDAPKHRGITMFIVDMRSPGIEIRPLRQITGGANFNEVFFTDTHIPHANVVGDVDEGWRAAITVLMNARMAGVSAQGGGGGMGGASVRSLIALARERGVDGDPVVRQLLAGLWIRSTIQRYTGIRMRETARSGRVPGPEGSIAKLYGAQLSRDMGSAAVAIAGTGGQAWDEGARGGDRWAMAVLSAPGSGIAGGTDQVQRNIIGERVLGLPKEPQVDRETPFRDLLVGTQRVS